MKILLWLQASSSLRHRAECSIVQAGLGRQVVGGLPSGLGGGAGLSRLRRQPKNSTSPVSRSYMDPAILTAPEVTKSARTVLRRRMSAIVSSTFLRATASTKA